LPLDEAQKREFERLTASEAFPGVQAMNTTWFEKGVEKGRRETLLELLEGRFGPLSADVLARVQLLSAEQLRSLPKELLKAQSLSDLGLVD
jgi:hypothetical protein